MKRRVIIITATLILSITFLTFLITLLGNVYSSKINYDIDEKLFSRAVGDGAVIYLAYDKKGELCEVWRDNTLGNSIWCDIEEVSDYIKLGFISMEDRDFYKHNGVNLKRTAFAAINKIFHLGKRFGASTITQQVIKNISGDNEITLKRKINEIFRAYHLENRHSKRDIFEVYLNIVPMPENSMGVKAASEMFFDKSPSDVSLAEAALIVGVTNSPTKYNPFTNPKEAIDKRNRVLYSMLDNCVISKAEYDIAVKEKLNLASDRKQQSRACSWFVETARQDIIEQMKNEYSVSNSSAQLMLRGCKVILTENIEVQAILDNYFSNTDNLPPAFAQGLNYSMVVIDNYSGNVIGIIGAGGEKQGERLLNYATLSVTPGSVLKPLALYAPLIEEKRVNASTLFDDIPIYYNNTDNGLSGYPKNSPDIYDGEITLADAVSYSKNTVAASCYNMLGKDKISNVLTSRYGFKLDKRDMYLSPLALGQLTNGVSIKELTRAYAAFANDGVIRDARTYLCVLDKNGEVMLKTLENPIRIMREDTARIMTSLLEGVTERGTARSIQLKNTVDIAGKTGTSGGDLDRLFVGYTPYFTAGIWCGYTDKSKEVSKNNPSHLQIFDSIMIQIHNECLNDVSFRHFKKDGLLKLSFSKYTGEVTNNQDSLIGYFTEDNLPRGYKEESYIPTEKKVKPK